MCGIAGLIRPGGSLEATDLRGLERMSAAMLARGPDGDGLWEADSSTLALAHRRLAILDLSASGAQPMTSRCGRFTIAFNGEIYNAPDLHRQHANALPDLRGTSDTEILLELFARFGEDILASLRGMFAAAIWDHSAGELVLFRDPFGIKPLYLARAAGFVAFSSQVRSLIASELISEDLDESAQRLYAIWGHVPEPKTLFRAIEAFPPGCWARVGEQGEIEFKAFQSVEDELAPGHEPCARPDLRSVLLDSVRAHLLSDVPVGVFLSAGIDSTTLASLAGEVGSNLRTLTLGFAEYRGTPSDEVPLAESVARSLGADHTTVWLTREDFEGALEEFILAMDQPSLDGLNTWLVARAAAEAGLKVTLSGLGGDELFQGYDSFRQLPRLRAGARRVPVGASLGAGMRRVMAPLISRFSSPKYASLLEYGGTWSGAYMLRRALRMPWEIGGNTVSQSDPSADDALPAWADTESVRTVSLLELTRYMRNQLLRDSDWAGMAHSLEIRVPLVDLEVLRACRMGHDAGAPFTKRDLAMTAAPALPKAIVDRPKSGFTVPVRDWLLEGTDLPSAGQRGLRGWADLVLQKYRESI